MCAMGHDSPAWGCSRQVCACAPRGRALSTLAIAQQQEQRAPSALPAGPSPDLCEGERERERVADPGSRMWDRPMPLAGDRRVSRPALGFVHAPPRPLLASLNRPPSSCTAALRPPLSLGGRSVGAAVAQAAEGQGEALAGEGGGLADGDQGEDEGPLNRKERRRLNKKLRSRTRNRLEVEDQDGAKVSIQRKEGLSQNFLVDQGIIDSMCNALQDSSPGGQCVLELGPGLGALTSQLLQDYPSLTAVELDGQACSELRTRFPKLKLQEGSLLDFDFEKHAKANGGRLSVISNLPFGITSASIYHILDGSEHIRRAVLLMQQEAAQRLMAEPEMRKYGTQSIEVAFRAANIRQLCAVPSIAFDPPPKNTKCAVIVIDFNDELPVERDQAKILRKCLQAAYDDKSARLCKSLPKSKALRESVPGLREYCEGDSNWLQKRPTDLAVGKWIHAARSLSAYASGAQDFGEDEFELEE